MNGRGFEPKRRRALLRQFGSVSGVKDAPLKELAGVSGMNERLARKVKQIL